MRPSRHCRCKARGGGSTRRSARRAASSCSRPRRYAFAATPPATTSVPSPGCSVRKLAAARAVRSTRMSPAAAWKLAQRSFSCGGSRLAGPSRSIVWRSAVLSPENEKWQPGWPSIGRGRSKRARSLPAPPARPQARPETPAPASWRPCRTPRRAHRRASCRAAGSGRPLRPRGAGNGRPRPAAGGTGNSTPSVSRAVSACASRWLIASSGRRCTEAIARAVASPTIRPPISPGPGGRRDRRKLRRRPRSASPCVCAISRSRISTCARAAISGTTPPNGACALELAAQRLGQHPAPAVDQRHRGLVAARLDAEHDSARDPC